MDEQKREITQAVAARIKYFRRIRSYSQEELALKANINPAYFGQVERGLKCPTIDTLYKIATALEVSPAALLRNEYIPDSTVEYSQKINELLSRVPAGQLGQVLQILEDIVRLF